MKNYRRIKKFGAAVTAAAMLGTLSVGVFADEVAPADELGIGDFIGSDVSEDVIVPDFVKDMEEDLFTGVPIIEDDIDVLGEGEGDTPTEPATPAETVDPVSGELLTSENIKITGVTLTKKADDVTAATPVYTYNAKLDYSINGVTNVTGKQVAVVGYTFGGTDETTAAGSGLTSGSAIYAIDQIGAATTGSITLKMTDDTTAPKHVAADSTLILKLGSDVVENCAPQAVAIRLAAATDLTEFTATYAEANKASITVAPGTSQEDIISGLAEDIEITVYDSEARKFSEGGFAATWALKSGETFGNQVGDSCVFEGTVQPKATPGNATLGTDPIKVEVTVSIAKLTSGTIEATKAEIKVGDTIPALSATPTADEKQALITALFGADGIKIKNGIVTDAPTDAQLTIAWKDGTALDTTAAGNTATLVVTVAAGVTAGNKFELEAAVNAEFEFTVKAAATYGDINDDGSIDMKDVGLALRAYLEKVTLDATQTVAADVNGDGEVNMKDVGAILRKYLEKLDKFEVEQ